MGFPKPGPWTRGNGAAMAPPEILAGEPLEMFLTNATSQVAVLEILTQKDWNGTNMSCRNLPTLFYEQET